MKKKWLLLNILIFILIHNLKSQDSDFHFKSIKKGVSNTAISAIVQDKLGFIWIGSVGTGLYKFDGNDYVNYRHELNNKNSLSNSRIEDILLDSKGRLWVATENGLNLYNRDLNHFTKIVFDSINEGREHILSLEEDSSNNLLIGTNGLGIFKIDLTNFNVIKIKESLISKNGDPLEINCIEHAPKGKTFVGTNDGLKEIDFVNNKLIHSRLFLQNKNSFDLPIEKLFIDKKSQLWIGSKTDKGVFRCELSDDVNNNIINIESYAFSQKKIMDFVQLSDNSIMIGTENDGLFHIKDNGELIKNYVVSNSDEKSILHNSIWSLFKDKDDRIWLGYYNSGVAVSDPLYDKFNHIVSIKNNENSLKIGSVMSLLDYDENSIWIAMDGGGIDVYDKNTHKINHINSNNYKFYSGLTSDYIETLFKDSNGNIWAGSWDKGIYYLQKGKRNFININTNNTRELASNTIMSFAEDNEGIIWVGTFFQGLHSYNQKTKKMTRYASKEFVEKNIHNADVRKIIVDKDNNIWIGSSIGLFKITKTKNGSFDVSSLEERMTEKYKNPADANLILSLLEDSNGNIWIGSQGAGLCKYDKLQDEFLWYNKDNGLEEVNIASIVQQNDHIFWISGNSGLTKIDVLNNNFTNYTYEEGLLTNDFNFGSVLKDSNGYLYFGNVNGVDFFDPKADNQNYNSPALYLKNFKIYNENTLPNTDNSPIKKVISETDHIVLNHSQSVFTIDYAGINFTRPEKNQYAYFLEGYENKWNYVGHKRSATYTNLNAGNYTFKLKSANNDGVWNEKPLEFSIKVLPAWWKTKLAIFIYISLFLFGIYLLNYFTQNRIKERELLNVERFQRQQKDDLNKRKIQFFTNISHEFRTPLTLIINPLKDIISDNELNLPQNARNKLSIIYKNTNRLYRLINELMDFRKLDLQKMKVRAESIELIEFTTEIISYFKEEASHKNILLSVDADTPDISVWGDRNMLEKIIFNLVSNALKVTPEGGAINVDLSINQKALVLPLLNKKGGNDVIEIAISDTGPGLKKDQVNKIFERFYQVERENKTYFGGTGIGLEVVQGFVELHKGKVEVESELKKGTTFKIYLPTGKAHFSKEDLIESVENTDISFKKEVFRAPPLITDKKDTFEEALESKGKTILLVEDNNELREYLKAELNKEYKVLEASNGVQGVKIVRERFPDLIITDIIMPEMNGFDFCRAIKTDPSTSHIPILMLTAKTSVENRIEGLEIGADAYMVKPFDLKLLKLRLSQLIKSRQMVFDKYFGEISGAKDLTNTTSLDKEFIQKLLEYINNRISDSNLSVEDLSAELNLSRSQLYRKVKALTGQTVNEFIRRVRLEKAKQIIENGSANISQTCYKVGFATPSYFSKCFKAYFGMLPTEVKVKV